MQPLGRNGAFEIGALPQGVYAVVLRGADGYPRDLVLAEFELGPGQSLDLGILTPVEPAGVEIDLVAEDGGLIEDPELTLAPVDGDLWVGHRLSRERGDAQGPFRSGALVPGAYTLVVHGGDHQDIAPHSARFELEPGESLRKRITVKRGKEQTFELTLPPHPNEKKPLFESPSARIDIELYRDVDSYLFRLRDRFELFDPSGNRLRLSLRLAPGTYRVVFEDHRDPALRRPRPSSEVEFDVPASGEPEVLLVELD